MRWRPFLRREEKPLSAADSEQLRTGEPREPSAWRHAEPMPQILGERTSVTSPELFVARLATSSTGLVSAGEMGHGVAPVDAGGLALDLAMVVPPAPEAHPSGRGVKAWLIRTRPDTPPVAPNEGPLDSGAVVTGRVSSPDRVDVALVGRLSGRSEGASARSPAAADGLAQPTGMIQRISGGTGSGRESLARPASTDFQSIEARGAAPNVQRAIMPPARTATRGLDDRPTAARQVEAGNPRRAEADRQVPASDVILPASPPGEDIAVGGEHSSGSSRHSPVPVMAPPSPAGPLPTPPAKGAIGPSTTVIRLSTPEAKATLPLPGPPVTTSPGPTPPPSAPTTSSPPGATVPRSAVVPAGLGAPVSPARSGAAQVTPAPASIGRPTSMLPAAPVPPITPGMTSSSPPAPTPSVSPTSAHRNVAARTALPVAEPPRAAPPTSGARSTNPVTPDTTSRPNRPASIGPVVPRGPMELGQTGGAPPRVPAAAGSSSSDPSDAAKTEPPVDVRPPVLLSRIATPDAPGVTTGALSASVDPIGFYPVPIPASDLRPPSLASPRHLGGREVQRSPDLHEGLPEVEQALSSPPDALVTAVITLEDAATRPSKAGGPGSLPDDPGLPSAPVSALTSSAHSERGWLPSAPVSALTSSAHSEPGWPSARGAPTSVTQVPEPTSFVGPGPGMPASIGPATSSLGRPARMSGASDPVLAARLPRGEGSMSTSDAVSTRPSDANLSPQEAGLGRPLAVPRQALHSPLASVPGEQVLRLGSGLLTTQGPPRLPNDLTAVTVPTSPRSVSSNPAGREGMSSRPGLGHPLAGSHPVGRSTPLASASAFSSGAEPAVAREASTPYEPETLADAGPGSSVSPSSSLAPVTPAPAQVSPPAGSTVVVTDPAHPVNKPFDIDELSRRIYERVRIHLHHELRLNRERDGLFGHPI